MFEIKDKSDCSGLGLAIHEITGRSSNTQG